MQWSSTINQANAALDLKLMFQTGWLDVVTEGGKGVGGQFKTHKIGNRRSEEGGFNEGESKERKRWEAILLDIPLGSCTFEVEGTFVRGVFMISWAFEF